MHHLDLSMKQTQKRVKKLLHQSNTLIPESISGAGMLYTKLTHVQQLIVIAV